MIVKGDAYASDFSSYPTHTRFILNLSGEANVG